jgi:uncharacterized protein YqgV (UPF0045/DUF77 family)
MVACQFALYPLGVERLGPVIDKALEAMQAPEIEIEPGPMSTLVTGDTTAVFAALERAFRAAEAEGSVVMSASFSNACPV